MRASSSDRGAVTVEAAIVLSAFMVIFSVVLFGISALFDQIRCVDAAREAARLVARGQTELAGQAVSEIAPAGTRWTVHREGTHFNLEVSAEHWGIPLHAVAYAMLEPSPSQ
jgi:membrane-bound ClpP family serine protease